MPRAQLPPYTWEVQKAPASNIEWKSWGKRDPLFGVASTKGKERGGANPWSDEEFFAAGRRDWVGLLPYWQRYGIDLASCLEIGCGAGRMTIHLAEMFQRVHAVDVSEDMLAYARERVSGSNVTFELVNGIALPLADASVSAAFSTHVFQHFDSADHAFKYFAEIGRVLAPGGTMMIHLPVYRWPTIARKPQLFDALYRLRKGGGDVRAWARRQLLRAGVGEPIMRYLSYRTDDLFATLPSYGFTDVEIVMMKPTPSSSVHPFLFARKQP